jgi:endonuclease-3 related protein
MAKPTEIKKIYEILMGMYGPQGWWPVSDIENGYHPGEYDFPKNEKQVFEICIGAILTQNTSWTNVQKAINNLKVKIDFTAEAVKSLDIDELSILIKPSGYFNQKAKKLKIFSEFIIQKNSIPTREELLSLWGIGPETADSILLYAYSMPFFVIDAYTRRIFENLGLAKANMNYEDLRHLFEENLPKDIIIYQEYHALLVEHAKRYYSKKPWGENCPLKAII